MGDEPISMNQYKHIFNNPSELPANYSIIADALERDDRPVEELYCRQKVMELRPGDAAAKMRVEELYETHIDRLYISQLNNKPRNIAFKEAIDKAVKAGLKTVFNIYSGNGLLSMLAAQSGATTVVAGDDNSVMTKMVRECVLKNGLYRKVEVKDNRLIERSGFTTNQKPSLIILNTDFDVSTLGNYLKDVHDTLHTYSKPGSQVMPKGATGYVTLVECLDVRNQTKHVYEYEADGCRSRTYHKLMIEDDFNHSEMDLHFDLRLDSLRHGCKRLSKPLKVFELDCSTVEGIEMFASGNIPFEFWLTCTDPGIFDALLFEWDLNIDDEIVLPSAVLNQAVAFYPVQFNCIAYDIRLKPGDDVNISMTCETCHLEFEVLSIDQRKSIGCVLDIEEMSKSDSDRLLENNGGMSAENTTVLSKMNSSYYGHVLRAFIRNFAGKSVLFIGHHMSFELTVFMTTGEFANICVYDASTGDTLDFLLDGYDGDERIDMEKRIMHFYCWNEFPDECCFDVVFVDFIDVFGKLDPNNPEINKLIHRVSRKTSGAKVFPGTMRIVGYLVESQSLLEQSLVFPDRTAGVNVAECMNQYKVRAITNLELSTLKRRRLSDKLVLMSFDFNHGQEHRPSSRVTETSYSTPFKITASGEAHAVVYWYEMDFAFEESIETLNTSHLEGYWKQAAMLLDDAITVEKDSYYKVKTVLAEVTIVDISVAKCTARW